MIKLLRKLEGKRTHIANTTGVIGVGLVALGLHVDPVQLAAAAAGSVDAVNNIVGAWDAGHAINWQQVGAGSAVTVVSQALVYVFRGLANKK